MPNKSNNRLESLFSSLKEKISTRNTDLTDDSAMNPMESFGFQEDSQLNKLSSKDILARSLSFKRVLCVVLSLVLIISMCVVSVYSASEDTEVTATSSVEIAKNSSDEYTTSSTQIQVNKGDEIIYRTYMSAPTYITLLESIVEFDNSLLDYTQEYIDTFSQGKPALEVYSPEIFRVVKAPDMNLYPVPQQGETSVDKAVIVNLADGLSTKADFIEEKLLIEVHFVAIETGLANISTTALAIDTPPAGGFTPPVYSTLTMRNEVVVEEAPTEEPTTAEPTTVEPTTVEPTTVEPTTVEPTTVEPTTVEPTTVEPTTVEPTTVEPTTVEPTTAEPTTVEPTTVEPTTVEPTTVEPTTQAATAIVNGKEFNVGDRIVFTYHMTSPTPLSGLSFDVGHTPGVLDYNAEYKDAFNADNSLYAPVLSKYSELTMYYFITDDNDGLPYLTGVATSIYEENAMKFTDEESQIIRVEFDVKQAGVANITGRVLEAIEYTPDSSYPPAEVTDWWTLEKYTGDPTAPTVEPETTTAEPTTVEPTTVEPTTAEPTTVEPTTQSATAIVNGKEFNVGDRIVFTYHMTSPTPLSGLSFDVGHTPGVLDYNAEYKDAFNADNSLYAPVLSKYSELTMYYFIIDNNDGLPYLTGVATSIYEENSMKFTDAESQIIRVEFDVKQAGVANITGRVLEAIEFTNDSSYPPAEVTDWWTLEKYTGDPTAPTVEPETTTAEPTTVEPTTVEPTTVEPTTVEPTTAEPTTVEPTTAEPTTVEPTTQSATAIVNGKEFNVGDRIVFTYHMTSPTPLSGLSFDVGHTPGVLDYNAEYKDAFNADNSLYAPVLSKYSELTMYYFIIDNNDGLPYLTGVATSIYEENAMKFTDAESQIIRVEFDVKQAGVANITGRVLEAIEFTNDSSYPPAEVTDWWTLEKYTGDPTAPTVEPTTVEPTTVEPTTAEPTTVEPTTAEPTTVEPTTVEPTTAEPTTVEPTTQAATAIVNGKEYNVGDRIVFTYHMTSPTPLSGLSFDVGHTPGILDYNAEYKDAFNADNSLYTPVLTKYSELTMYYFIIDKNDGLPYLTGVATSIYEENAMKFTDAESQIIRVEFDVKQAGVANITGRVLEAIEYTPDSSYPPAEVTDWWTLEKYTADPTAPTVEPETTTAEPTTVEPTTVEPTTVEPTTVEPTTVEPTTVEPTTAEPTTVEPTTVEPTTVEPTTHQPSQAVINDVVAEVKDTVIYSVYLNAEEKIKGLQMKVKYDSSMLEIDPEFIAQLDSIKEQAALMGIILTVNLTDSEIEIIVISNSIPLDFTDPTTPLMQIPFNVVGEGESNIQTTVYEVFNESADVNYDLEADLEVIPAPTEEPTTVEPTTVEPTTVEPTTVEPTTVEPTTVEPTTVEPTTVEPTTVEPTTVEPTTVEPTTVEPTTVEPTTVEPTTVEPTTVEPTTVEPTTVEPTTVEPTTVEPTTVEPTTAPEGPTDPTSEGETTTAPDTDPSETPTPAPTTNGDGSGGKVVTGDSTSVVALLSILLLAAGVVVIARRKREGA